MKKKKVLLINTNLIKPPITPIGLDYIGSTLQRHGFDVELLDLCFSNNIKESIRKKLKDTSFLAVGINIRNTDDCYFLSQDNFLPRIKDMIAQIRDHSDSPVIAGGGGFSVMPIQTVKYLNVDFGIAGDGEFAFPGLLKNIEEGKKDQAFMESIGGPAHGVIVSRYEPLDKYPPPDRDLVDNKRYFREGGMGNIETRRGCSRKCIYCADPLIKGCRIRTRPVSIVIEEIKNLIDMDIDHIHFCDSEFNIPIDYATSLLKQVIENKLGDKMRWYSYMSPVPFDESFVKLLKMSGCEGINFGVDSADPVVLKNLGREHGPGDLAALSKLCLKYKIKFMIDLLLGGPGEDKKTVKHTIDSIKNLSPYCVGISYGIRVYPGTILSDMIKDEPGPGKNLYGNINGNKNFFKPVFYISGKIGKELVEYANGLVSGDDRFFIGATGDQEKNYNYNKNLKLQEAIKNGYRGAYWDILQRLNSGTLNTNK